MSIEVPFLQDGEIEQEADGLIAEYCREQRKAVKEPQVPIEDLVELHLQLIFEFKDLHQELGFPDIHGAIWVNEGRIAIDNQLDPQLYPAKRGRYHFTLAHETGHWRLHRKYFIKREERHLFDGAAPPPDFIGRSGKKNRVEVQANQFAACLLMPRHLVRQEWERWHGDLDAMYLDDLGDRRGELLQAELLRRGSAKPGPEGETDKLLEQLSRPMADRFHVSPEAMRYRLEACGLLGAKRPATLF
jgi:Zn-dependent peptidase ImmA (M78 family)